jgi:hypothetical protein
MRSIARKLSLAAVLALASVPTGALAAIFDGDWTVTVVTERGKCDHTYSYHVRVNGGAVHYTDYNSVSVGGTVTPQGVVRVGIRHHDDTASGIGHLGERTGSGEWHGSGKDGACSGRWRAQRRQQ